MNDDACGCTTCTDCPLEAGMKHLAGSWKTMLIFRLLEKSRRFSELERIMPGISSKVLTAQLDALCDAQVIERVPLSPRHVEYRLTEFGRKLEPALEIIFEWGATALANQAVAEKTRAQNPDEVSLQAST